MAETGSVPEAIVGGLNNGLKVATDAALVAFGDFVGVPEAGIRGTTETMTQLVGAFAGLFSGWMRPLGPKSTNPAPA